MALDFLSVFIQTRCHPLSVSVLWSAWRTRPLAYTSASRVINCQRQRLADGGPCSGDWRADLRRVLGIPAERVGDSVKGFAGEAALGGDDYLAGIAAGLPHSKTCGGVAEEVPPVAPEDDSPDRAG
jgi:hypothetical protein